MMKTVMIVMSMVIIVTGFVSINPILIWFYPHKQRQPHLPHSNSNPSHSPYHSIHVILLQTNNQDCSPSPLASSTSSLVVLTSSCPSLKTPMLFSEHAHHPSSTHAWTISLHSPLPSEPLFPSLYHSVNGDVMND